MKTPLEQLKALADRNRLRVVATLMNTDELCACQISGVLGVSGATASRHMELLIRAGLVDSRKVGRWVYYKLSPAFPSPLFQWLDKTLSEDPELKADRVKLLEITGCK
jgi:ArsR family transcriptional regulator